MEGHRCTSAVEGIQSGEKMGDLAGKGRVRVDKLGSDQPLPLPVELEGVTMAEPVTEPAKIVQRRV